MVSYCFLRSSIKFQGRPSQKNRLFESSLSEITRPVAAIKSLKFALFLNIISFSVVVCFKCNILVWNWSSCIKVFFYCDSHISPRVWLRICHHSRIRWWMVTLQWRHNEQDVVSNHQPQDCLLNSLFRRRSKKTSKLCVTGLCEGNSPVISEFHAQRASNVENVSIWWHHHKLALNRW